MKKILPIKDKPVFTAYLDVAAVCAILEADTRHKHLFFCSFINSYWNADGKAKYRIYDDDFFDYLMFEKTVVSPSLLQFKRNNIVKLLKRWIDSDFYIYAYINEAELSGTQLFGNTPIIHDSLIFGYDDDSHQFLIMNYNAEKRFGRIPVSYSEIKNSVLRNIREASANSANFFNRDISCNQYPQFVLLKPCTYICEKEIEVINRRLKFYIDARNIKTGKLNNLMPNDYYWGIETYSAFYDYVSHNTEYDYRFFKLLEEHIFYFIKLAEYLKMNDVINHNHDDNIKNIVKTLNFKVLIANKQYSTKVKEELLCLLQECRQKEYDFVRALIEQTDLYLASKSNVKQYMIL